MDKNIAVDKPISPALHSELASFFSTHPPRRVSRNLRRVLLDFLQDQLKTGVPVYLDQLLWDLYYLFELLDVAAVETAGWPNKRDFPDTGL